MKKYKILIVKEAKEDMRDTFKYIAKELCEPQIANRIYNSIYLKIVSLETMPNRNPLIDDVSYKVRGIRMLLAENYRVFYIVDEKDGTVKVLRVIYNRREWKNLI